MSSTELATDAGPLRRQGAVAGFRRLYYGQTRFDFARRKRIWFLLSAIVILAGIVSLFLQGLNFDIEFVGGTSWEAPSHGVTVTEARNALGRYGLSGSDITTLGSGSRQELQVEAKAGKGSSATSSKLVNEVSDALAKLTHTTPNAVSVSTVGPTWGSQVTQKAVIALIVFLILISIYISIFFEWKMALAAIVAVLHDVLVTVGIYSLSRFLVDPDTVVAFLTILGYSLYDTIVVFDRVRDNIKGLGATGKLSFTDVVNLSMNQTLARSINTSLVAIMPILAVLVLGADVLGATTLQYFGLALLIGLASGAYSSIFIASPLVALLKEREPRYVQIRQRLESRGTMALLLTPAAVASGALDDRGGGGGRARRGRRGSSRGGSAGPLRPSGSSAPAGHADIGGEMDEDEEVFFDELDDEPSRESGNGAAPKSGGASTARQPAARSGASRPASSRAGASRSGGGGQSRGGGRSGGQKRPGPRPRKRRRR